MVECELNNTIHYMLYAICSTIPYIHMLYPISQCTAPVSLYVTAHRGRLVGSTFFFLVSFFGFRLFCKIFQNVQDVMK